MENRKKTVIRMIATAAVSAGVTAAVAGGIAAARNTKRMKMMRAAQTTGEVLCRVGTVLAGKA